MFNPHPKSHKPEKPENYFISFHRWIKKSIVFLEMEEENINVPILSEYGHATSVVIQDAKKQNLDKSKPNAMEWIKSQAR